MSDAVSILQHDFWQANGYLILEEFIEPDHVRRLSRVLGEVVERRRREARDGRGQTGMTWMIASQEHWGYPGEFYQRLTAERSFFHGFLFDPPEPRWG